MPLGDTERESVLIKIVTDRDLPAKGVSAPLQRKPVQIIGVRLDQDRNLQSRKLDGVGNALFIAEVRQHDQNSIDSLPMLVKERGAFLGILPGLDAAEFRRIG